MSNNKVILGGIINHNKVGVGFKITFQDKETANRYKEMIRWFLLDEGYKVATNLGYHDDKELDYR